MIFQDVYVLKCQSAKVKVFCNILGFCNRMSSSIGDLRGENICFTSSSGKSDLDEATKRKGGQLIYNKSVRCEVMTSPNDRSTEIITQKTTNENLIVHVLQSFFRPLVLVYLFVTSVIFLNKNSCFHFFLLLCHLLFVPEFSVSFLYDFSCLVKLALFLV